MLNPSIFSYIKSEESKYETEQIRLGDNWTWNMRDHIQMIHHLKNGQFYTGENDWSRSFKQIMEPILNLCAWTEDIDVKDVTFFVEDDDGKVLSFLVKKYHDNVYTREHDLDALFDKITENDLTFGGVLIQKGVDMPEVLPFLAIAFCDQTNLTGGPIGFKSYFSPDKIRTMSKYGWGEKKNGATISLDELAILASNTKELAGDNGKPNEVSGKVIEVYIVRGNLPEAYLKDNDNMEDYYNQVHIVGFYTDKDHNKVGVTLYRKRANENDLIFFTSNEVYQRALGRGVGEQLLGPQIWTNFLTIHKTNLLATASKVPLYTDDPNFSNRNSIQDMENLEITVIEEGKSIGQIPTAAPNNIQLLQNAVNEWFENGQFLGAAFDPILGKEATSGTTFRGQERTVAQGKGSHDQRRGKRAKLIEQLYREMILPDMKKDIISGKKFLADLSLEELTWLAEEMSVKLSNKRIKQMLLDRKMMTREQQDEMIKVIKDTIIKRGNKQLIEILKDEFENIEINIGINVAGKQKDLATLSDKILSIFQFIFANPQGFQQAMQMPALSKAFENILEFSGMSIANFSSLMQAPVQPVAQAVPQGASTGTSMNLNNQQVQTA